MDIIKINKFNYYEAVDKPSDKELSEYYSKKYYQENKSGAYSQFYSSEEVLFFKNKIKQKHYVLENLFNLKDEPDRSLLDIGCGEGWTLQFFKERRWNVVGIDFSNFSCKNHNPQCVDNLLIGDTYKNLESFRSKSSRFDVIWISNVLEHVIEPLNLLNICKDIIKPSGVLIIEVPNDFSSLQKYLIEKNYINREFWISLPDHLNYFNKDGLNALAKAVGWESKFIMSDFPIDFNLLNKDTNYIIDKNKGNACHRSRVEIENFLHSISVEKTVNYYHSLAELGLGRQIIAFFQLY